MIGHGPLGGFQVQPRDIIEIRDVASSFSGLLRLEGGPERVLFGRLLDRLSVEFGIPYDVLSQSKMPNPSIEAYCNPSEMSMCFREDVFKSICSNGRRGRFTVAHEIGHLMLGHERTVNKSPRRNGKNLKFVEDSEWQANQFAAEFLMPLATINRKGLWSPNSISEYFIVSKSAAARRYSQLSARKELKL